MTQPQLRQCKGKSGDALVFKEMGFGSAQKTCNPITCTRFPVDFEIYISIPEGNIVLSLGILWLGEKLKSFANDCIQQLKIPLSILTSSIHFISKTSSEDMSEVDVAEGLLCPWNHSLLY